MKDISNSSTLNPGLHSTMNRDHKPIFFSDDGSCDERKVNGVRNITSRKLHKLNSLKNFANSRPFAVGNFSALYSSNEFDVSKLENMSLERPNIMVPKPYMNRKPRALSNGNSFLSKVISDQSLSK